METIFDHNITLDELEQITGSRTMPSEWFNELSEVCNLGWIYRLYIYRGDKDKARQYLARIPNSDWKNFQLAYHDNAT